MFAIELEKDVYLSDWGGHLPITYLLKNARLIYSEDRANKILKGILEDTSFEDAMVIQVQMQTTPSTEIDELLGLIKFLSLAVTQNDTHFFEIYNKMTALHQNVDKSEEIASIRKLMNITCESYSKSNLGYMTGLRLKRIGRKSTLDKDAIKEIVRKVFDMIESEE